mmetsp:Transcript_36294/g.91429  ORF Transcript_36294/g.91429 Transcript_36294/m.91429 type:complete len:342 (+) Transcript_36294:520-1545(+)
MRSCRALTSACCFRSTLFALACSDQSCATIASKDFSLSALTLAKTFFAFAMDVSENSFIFAFSSAFSVSIWRARLLSATSWTNAPMHKVSRSFVSSSCDRDIMLFTLIILSCLYSYNWASAAARRSSNSSLISFSRLALCMLRLHIVKCDARRAWLLPPTMVRRTCLAFFADSSSYPMILALALLKPSCTSWFSNSLVSRPSIFCSILPNHLSYSSVCTITSCPAWTTALFKRKGRTPTFSADSRASSAAATSPLSTAARKRVVVEATKESCKKKCSNCSGLFFGIFSTSSSIILSSVFESMRAISSRSEMWMPCAVRRRSAAETVWPLDHCTSSNSRNLL